MRYLKLFEDNKGYEEVDEELFNSSIKLEIPDNIIESLEETFNFDIKLGRNLYNLNNKSGICLSDDDYYFLVKCNDEKTGVTYNGLSYYKCDQLYGLKKCIKKEVIK